MTARRLGTAVMIAALVAVAVPSSAPGASTYGARVMKMGTKGKDVRKLQRNLSTLGYPTPADGVFGITTKRNVKKVERKERWKINGRVSRGEARKIAKLVARRTAKKPKAAYYVNSLTAPTLTLTSAKAGDAAVAIKNTATGEKVDTRQVSFDSAGTKAVSWGAILSEGTTAPEGTYRMNVSDPGSARAAVAGGQTTAFLLRWHIFPLAGPHDYGGKASRFGAGRGDHTHQGQDMAAACGQKLYVATGGTVTAKAYQAGGAGYYIVIKGSATGGSYVYMHMQKASWAQKGQTVYTGQQIGKAGNTGASTGCHLHFERWTPPGWYAGGKAYDPRPELKYWDGYS